MAEILGTNNSESLPGNDYDDSIFAFGGDDVLWGLGGNDYLSGMNGEDILYGIRANILQTIEFASLNLSQNAQSRAEAVRSLRLPLRAGRPMKS